MCDHKYKYRKREDEHCPYDKHGKVPWKGKTYCIFHAPMEAKEDRIDEFWEKFFNLIKKFRNKKTKEWDFEAFVFPDTEKNSKKRFREYKFSEGVKVNFRWSEFTGNADFRWAQFSGDPDFHKAKFTDKARFFGAQFSGGANFSEAQFSGDANFVGTEFTGEAYFLGTEFLGGADFTGTQFLGVVGFVDATLGRKVTFRSTDFHSQVDFQSASISELDFTGATFRVKPYMGALGAASKEVVIENLVGDVVMEFVRGYKKLDEKKETYEKVQEEPFALRVKGGEIDGVFSVRAPLDSIKLKGTTFRATVNISPKKMYEMTLLRARGVNFLAYVTIEDVNLQGILGCTIGGGFLIAESNLSKARFRRVDLSLIDFANVSWTKILRMRSSLIFLPLRLIGKVFKKFGSRLSRIMILYRETVGLYNEVIMGDMKTLKDIFVAPNLKEKHKDRNRRLEEMYRAMASAYEGRRRYGRAGHFKAAEFELRRLHTSKLERIVLACYRWASFYGEEPLKPLAILLLTIFIPALFYFFNGVPELVLHKGAQNFKYTHYGPYFGEGLKFSLQPLWDFIKSIAFSFQACLPVKTTLVDQLTGWCAYLPPLQRGLSVIFTAFLLFALRRKARR